MSSHRIDALLLDMDGVLYHGDRVIAEAPAFMRAVAHLPHLFITNNPILPPDQVAGKLARLGFAAPHPEQILTSAEATARWLDHQRPGFRYFAVGAAGLDAALRTLGTPDPENADFVVVGEGPGLDFDSLTTGINLILQRGAMLISTNPDTTVDAVRDGHHIVVPGGGALVAPFAAASGREPLTIGKPNPILYQMALERLGCDARHCLMIGDRPDTDIAGAARLGMATALVRTGRFAPGTHWPAGLPRPDWDVDSLSQLLPLLPLG